MSTISDVLGKRLAAKVQLMALSTLTPNPRNPRVNDAAVDAVAASIMRFGFNNPILVDQDKRIVAGHTRYLAAQKLEIENVPVIVLPHLTGTLFDAFAIADNQTASLSEWNLELLEETVFAIRAEDETLLKDMGFDEPTLLELLRERSDFKSEDGDTGGSNRRLDTEPLITCPHCGGTFKRSDANVAD